MESPGGAAPCRPTAAAAAVLRETRQFYVALDEAGTVLAWNRAAARTFGFSEQQALGANLEELIIPASHLGAHRRGIADFVRTGHGRGVDEPVQVEAVRADGSSVPVELTIWAQRTEDGYIFHALGSDLSERRAHEQVLRVLAEHRRALLHSERPEHAAQLLVETACRASGCHGAWLYVPDQASAPSRLTLAAESLAGASPAPASIEQDERSRIWTAMTGSLSALYTFGPQRAGLAEVAGLHTVAVEPVIVGGLQRGVLVLGWTQPQSSPLPEATQHLLALLAAEAGVVMQRLERQQQMTEAAVIDSLTGLPNRRAFDESLSRHLRQVEREGDPLVLVLVDLDDFKAHNDQHGHPAGDDLLRRTAQAWLHVVRSPELLARIGGDEFALILPGADLQAASSAVARLVAATPDEASVTVGVSAHRAGDDPGALLQRADQELYRGKRARRPV
jgi:diguanylate cyclase (GGDEF)-like protein/PAS domain S-box-containing protein